MKKITTFILCLILLSSFTTLNSCKKESTKVDTYCVECTATNGGSFNQCNLTNEAADFWMNRFPSDASAIGAVGTCTKTKQ